MARKPSDKTLHEVNTRIAMKTSLLSSLCLLVATVLPAREFTDPQGRKLEAEVVSVTGSQAVLKRTADGRAMTVNIATFSEADQKFLKEFEEANAKYSFEVKWTKKKLGETKRKSNNVTYETERWVYKIEIKNRMPTPVSDVRVDYWCFRKEDGGKGKGSSRIETSGTTTIPSIPGAASTVVDSNEIELNKQKLDGGFYFINGDSAIQSDGMGGLAVRIFDKNGKEVHKWATKDDLLAAAVGKPMANGSNADKPK